MAERVILLIDGHSLLFQVFHAIPEMTSPSGLPTNALYGFTRDLLFLRNEKKPDYLLCTFDRTEKQSRVVILLDITPSMTAKSDEVGNPGGRKPRTRIETVIAAGLKVEGDPDQRVVAVADGDVDLDTMVYITTPEIRDRWRKRVAEKRWPRFTAS